MPRLSKIGAAALAAFGWTGLSTVTASYLVVAGGGGGGTDNGGGGGAGGYLETSSASLNPTLSYTVIVGAGGAGGASPSGGRGSTGSDSSFSASTANGGGGGGGPATSSGVGGNGGSGGGGDGFNAAVGGTATQGNSGGATGYGNNGGTGDSGGANRRRAGGGGGASAAGENGSAGAGSLRGGNGGAGRASSISGSSVTYAGGGGGGNRDNNSSGGAGGGGGGGGGSVAGTAGTANTGGGGGGGGDNAAGAQGGSGVVIISYAGAQKFGGGVVTSVGGNTIHTFTTSGTLSPLSSLTASYLIVAGGGGGGSNITTNSGGGGGAGGLLSGSSLIIDTNSVYAVTVGAGGAGSSSGGTPGTNGSSSTFSLVSTTAVGGGGGGDGLGNANAVSGGSGGGGGSGSSSSSGASGTAGQGNAGGNGAYSAPGYPGGGGGGASAAGGNATSTTGGNGGAGTASSISGSSVTYAGGGGGGAGAASGTAGGTGGAGGGGNGAVNSTPQNGTANRGGGGGGVGYGAAGSINGGSGGSGIVIISYPGSTPQMAGGTVTAAGGNIIHTFTSSGYLTPITNLNNSLRFRSSASASLSRTPTSTGNRRTFTFSAWVKFGTIGTTNRVLASCVLDGNNRYQIQISDVTADQLTFQARLSSTEYKYWTSSAVFRDPSAWYHIVFAIDTTQATGSDRIKVYVNGVQQSGSNPTTITQNTDTFFNYTVQQNIGNVVSAAYFDGYMTEVQLIDGQQLTANSFGAFNGQGVWQPVRYGGSYGTNGFYLPFTNTTSTTTLGYDFSPNGNNWTTNNISLTAGSTYDSMRDVPTNTSATVANYCVLNPLSNSYSGTTVVSSITNGNLNFSDSSSSNRVAIASMTAPSGKWYFEMTSSSTGTYAVGLMDKVSNAGSFYRNNGTYSSSFGGGGTSGYSSWTSGDVIGVAWDADAGKLWFAKNNTWQGSGNPSAGTNPTNTFTAGLSLFADIYTDNSAGTKSGSFNFGQQPFTYTPPSGFVALNTFNLPTPTIGATPATTANKYFDAILYTGNSPSSQTVATGFYPDLIWQKSRTQTYSNVLYDSVRGVQKRLSSNETAAESTVSTSVTAFSSSGFTIGSDGELNDPTGGSNNHVAWVWNANSGSTVSNTAGSITSTVSANTAAGFSIVTYTGNGSAGSTVGHGLGVAPSMIIVKKRNTATSSQWTVGFSSLGWDKYILLNTTGASATDSNVWNSTPTSSVFYLGNDTWNNGSTNTYVAYCFAQVAGYSAFGSYTGNGSSDGVFIYTGFRPRFVMYKNASYAGTSWAMLDSSRNTYNVLNARLFADGSDAENTATTPMDFTSNGFKVRSTNDGVNRNGDTIIYMAFAENPFKIARAR